MTPIRGTSPLLIFLLIGIGVFVLDRWLDEGDAERGVITVTDEQVETIHARWVAQWGRAPCGRELQGLFDEAVREEILYQEALRLVLDRDEPIVRRRLAQKMTFMLEDNPEVPAPAAREVEAHHAAHAERYREPRRTTFRHVFLSGDRRADAVHDAMTLLNDVRAAEDGRWRQLGDPFMLLRRVRGSDRSGGRSGV